MLGSASLSKEQLIQLAPLLEQAGPLELRDLVRPFQRNSSLETRSAFLTSLEQSRAFLSLPYQEFSDIIKGYPPELLPRANALLDKLKEKESHQVQRLDQLLPLLASGDVKRGQQLFASEKTKCALCHQINGKGGKIGPDLSNIGNNRHSRDLLESIVFPSASLVRQYEPFSVVTTEGRVLTGLISRETTSAIYVQQQVGEPVMVARKDIEELVPSTVSIMPKGLEQALREEDLADLISYLKTLKTAP
jgi:putative heme-binding domain-containing protein